MIAAAGMDHHPIPDPPEEKRAPIVAKTAGAAARRAQRPHGRRLHPHRQPRRLPARARRGPELAARISSCTRSPRTPRRSRPRPPACPPSASGSPRAPSGSSSGRRSRPRSATCAPTSGSSRIPELERFHDMPFFTLAPPSLEDPGARRPAGRPALPRGRRRHAAPAARTGGATTAWPLVYLTFGSVAPTMDYFPGLYRDAIDALARAAGARARDRRPRARPARARAAGAQRPRRRAGCRRPT